MADYGIRLNADGSGLVGASTAAADAAAKLSNSFAELKTRAEALGVNVQKVEQSIREAGVSQKMYGQALEKALEQEIRWISNNQKVPPALQASAKAAEEFVARLKEKSATLGMTGAQVERYRAENMKLSDAQRASVESSLAQIRTHELSEKAAAAAATAAKWLTAAVVGLTGATAWAVKGSIDEAAGLHNLSQSYSVSTQALSAYRYQMNLAGVSGSEFEAAMRNLSQRVQEAQQGTGRGAQLFAAFGGELQRAAQRGAPLEKLLPLLADQFASYANSTNKTALAADTFGTAVGARMIPALNQGAAGLREATKEAAEFQRIIGPDHAAQAEQFNSNMTRMNALFTGTKYAIAQWALPALNDWIERLIAAGKVQGSFADKLANFIVNPGAGDRKWQAMMDEQNRRNEIAFGVRPDGTAIRNAPVIPGGGGAGGAGAQDAYAKSIEQLKALIEVQELEAATGEKVTQAQRLRLQSQELLNTLVAQGREEEYLQVNALLDSVRANELNAQARDKNRRAADEATRSFNAGVDAQWKSVASIEEHNARLAEHNREIGLSKEQVDLLKRAQLEETIALLENKIALAEGKDSQEAWLVAAKARLDALKETARLLSEGSIAERAAAEATKASSEWRQQQESMWQSIDRTAHDTFVSIFESGKGAFTRLRDTLKNTLYDFLYQMTLRPFVIQIAAAVTGMGASGGALASLGGGASSGGLGGIGNLLGVGQRAFGLFSGAGGADYLSGLSTGLFSSSADLAGLIESGTTGFAGAGLEAAAGLSSTLSWAPFVAGALQAIQGNVAAGIGTTLGGIAGSYFGPVGTAVGSFLGGQIGGFFGGGEEKVPHAKGSLRMDDEGNFYIKFADVEGIAREEMNAPDILALNAALNDPRQYDPELLKAIVGQVVQGPRGAPGTATLEKLGALFAPAQTSAQEYTAKFNASLGGTGVLSAGIAGYVGGMSVSEYLSPEQRLAGARSMYDTALQAAGSGDALASQALPGLANQLLGAGRTMYASGPQFQDMFTQVNNDMKRVLDQSVTAQQSLLAELPAAFREANQDTIKALQRLADTVKEGLDRLNAGLRGMGNNGSPAFGGT